MFPIGQPAFFAGSQGNYSLRSQAEINQHKGLIMYSMLPGDAMAGALEMVCYSFTVVAAVVSCLLSLRF
jgi:hypothetical protein